MSLEPTYEASGALGLAIADEAMIVLTGPDQIADDVLDEGNVVYFDDRTRENMELGVYLEVIRLLGDIAGKDIDAEIDETKFRQDLARTLANVAVGAGGISDELARQCGIADTTPWYLK